MLIRSLGLEKVFEYENVNVNNKSDSVKPSDLVKTLLVVKQLEEENKQLKEKNNQL